MSLSIVSVYRNYDSTNDLEYFEKRLLENIDETETSLVFDVLLLLDIFENYSLEILWIRLLCLVI